MCYLSNELGLFVLLFDSLPFTGSLKRRHFKFIKACPCTITAHPLVKVLRKDFDVFKNICKITNIDILTCIIDDYNQINTTRTDIFPDKIKKYIKKHKNQV